MKKLVLILLLAACCAVAFYVIPPKHQSVVRARIAQIIPVQMTAEQSVPSTPWASALITAARSQVGVTTRYDGSYVSLGYPMGDIDRKTGVCTDVVIRALRDAHGIDLQKLVHEDMRRAFGAYPKNWGLKRADRNIDHRRVPNLRRYFERQGAALKTVGQQRDFRPGDIVTWMLGPGVPHIGILSDRTVAGTDRLMVLHNVGGGAHEEDFLFAYPMTGHYRLSGAI